MNQQHLEFLASPEWRQMLQTDLLPWVAGTADLGDDVVEVGPGPGLTTDLLRQRAARVTAIELDPQLAAALSARLSGTNVTVLQGDATRCGLRSGAYSAVTCFSVLHHIPSPGEQDRLFAEVARLLRPGGTFVGADSLDTERTRAAHHDDVFVPVDPATLEARLAAAGLSEVVIDRGDYQMRFRATKPANGG